ncbi:bifunctional 2-C-methyl-D-erythritol 4-phosphate cytidylyltransferase/2-C-methyl-D-erythritol 2,4-cyclodiphosphate synthase [Aliiroseovarius sp. F20344]|uniref:bifunctional 2-C-methyl-D-erythritol 4-phosphate cytidylyltransferase/2-C-methyl-D-erythritol 2,4-cyclodiphosphate synthase n=1 Tax=Aliiroseovarius sp. F20344 TaxID=2926414 RepID=UPI001FF6677C|nr:bifunctional 2-C-methyl-D-erythritol 4-phosphate cytidylyltransferase/2-C-methyl-D-erythritol 2,4-cyclodiphosphate synthase [Aliiroseovarius sp. F20344]MCK0143581.1 bifunctional 2-C-methyl-D-erythritol 4-phosphate cytidylyltransferase/2-C-methyl-D-erythritol 2,4-cyclodiphosphate synthase [Aliiroseovarius sp. F20344]
MNTAAIIVAAGRGTRAGGEMPKQWRQIAGDRIAAHTVQAFRAHPGVSCVVLVIHPDDEAVAASIEGVTVVQGGASRDASVRAGLEALAANAPDLVLIHDVARPLVSAKVIDDVIAALDTAPGAAPALAVTDALWRGSDQKVSGTQDRSGLYRAQTPQGFRFAEILAAHQSHLGGAADDVEVARAAHLDVAIVDGDEQNLKITTPEDFERAERLLLQREQNNKESLMDVRVGSGYDVHAFEDGDHVILCGVKIPYVRKLRGHSDADVGMHALTDAIYGALADGDIGQHFPPSDPQWKGAASDIFLRHAVALAGKRGFRFANVDVTLICEHPKIGPHAHAMRAALSDIMGLAEDRISVKATTSERLGFTGRSEGIAAMASATLIGA